MSEKRFKNRTRENINIQVKESVGREETRDAGENLEDKTLKPRGITQKTLYIVDPGAAKKSFGVRHGRRASSWTLR